jgi:ligand-binding sensor domain-containing protein
MGGDKLVYYDGNTFIEVANQLEDRISHLASGHENQMWVANLSELASLSLQTTSYAPSFLTGPLVDVLAKDATHGIWIGAADGSIWHFDGNNFQKYPIPDLEGYNSVEAVVVKPDGRVIAGFLQGEIFELNVDSGLWKNIGSENFTQLYTMSFANDQLWVVASVESEQRAFSFDGTSWQELGIAFNDGEIVRTIFNAADNTVWIGSSAGVIRFEPESGEYERLTQADGLVDNNVTTICKGQNNAIWIGTQVGLSRYTP